MRTTAGQLSGVLGDQGVWAKVISGLLEGSQGPTLPLVVISKLESELRALLQTPLLSIEIFGRLLLVREVNSNCIAQAEQCFLLHDGTFAQLTISTSSPTGDVLCMVSPFETVPYAPEKGRYMVFWWLQRCDHFSLVSVTQNSRRERVIPGKKKKENTRHGHEGPSVGTKMSQLSKLLSEGKR